MYELIATSTFGLEAVVRRELESLGFKVTATENGKVTFLGDERGIAKSNLMLGTADRVLIKMAEFKAVESDDLFFNVKSVAWEDLIPEDGKFTVNCSTVKSVLRSEPNNQKTVKKAVVERLRDAYGLGDAKLPETGAEYTIKVSLLKDVATITLDTTGPSLHKRGYRKEPVEAPLKETLASALVRLSFFKPGRVLIDPCCGSGTIAIEAAMMDRGIMPGASRRFASEDWDAIPKDIWDEERKAAEKKEESAKSKIVAMDIDPRAIKAAKANAEAAGVGDSIDFRQGDIKDVLEKAADGLDNGIIITNPPYGERIGDREKQDHIFRALNSFMKNHDDWSVFVITPDRSAEKKIAGRAADRRRKLYNGNIEVCYYQFHGKKPGK